MLPVSRIHIHTRAESTEILTSHCRQGRLKLSIIQDGSNNVGNKNTMGQLLSFNKLIQECIFDDCSTHYFSYISSSGPCKQELMQKSNSFSNFFFFNLVFLNTKLQESVNNTHILKSQETGTNKFTNCNRSVLCYPPHCLELHLLGKEH